MDNEKHWYLLSYDIRLPKRWRKAYKILKGRGEHLQYSVFRLYMNKTQLQEVQWQLNRVLAQEDDLLIIRLCPNCANRTIMKNGGQNLGDPPPPFEIF